MPYNGENFRTIKFNCFEFNDSLAFLQASLEQLSDDLSKTDNSYEILKQSDIVKTNNVYDPKKFKMLLKKSFFPYEYCTNLKLMKKTKKIPPIEAFHSSLRETTISPENYQFAKKVWKTFNCKNLLDYTTLYCELDTILLAEIFQRFRKDMHKFSGLDPAQYISLPGYAFDSMLKATNCEITLPTDKDIDKIHFIESGIRGGMSFIGTRKLERCNSSKKEKKSIEYIDANVSFLISLKKYVDQNGTTRKFFFSFM